MRDVHGGMRTLARLFIFAALVAGASPASVQGAELPPAIRTALQANAAQLSPITVSWQRQLVSSRDPATTLQQLGLSSHEPKEFFAQSKLQAAWQDGQLYSKSELLTSDGESSFVITLEASYDGSKLYCGDVRPRNVTLFKQFQARVMRDEPDARPIDFTYFEAAGFHVPGPASDLAHPRIEAGPLYLLDHGGKLQSVGEERTVDGTVVRLTIVAPNPAKQQVTNAELRRLEKMLSFSKETAERKQEIIDGARAKSKLPDQRTFVFDLDPALHYAVRRWEQRYDPGQLLLQGECDQFEKLTGRDLALPRSCVVHLQEFHTRPGVRFEDAFLSEQHRVTAIDLKPIPAERFALNYTEPGTYVRDATLPEAQKDPSGYVSYTIPASLGNLDNVIMRARNGEKFRPQPRPAPKRSWFFLGVIVAVNAGALVIYLAYRWRAARQGADQTS